MASLSKKRRAFMRARIMAYDIVSVLDDAEKGDLSTLAAILEGEWGLPGKFTDSQLLEEWREGEYDGPRKEALVKASPTYHRHEYVRQLWDGAGNFHGQGSAKFQALGKR